MSNPLPIDQCLNCSRTEDQIPLVSLKYRGTSEWICSQCLPILIHNPGKLFGRLEGAENIEPSAHHDD